MALTGHAPPPTGTHQDHGPIPQPLADPAYVAACVRPRYRGDVEELTAEVVHRVGRASPRVTVAYHLGDRPVFFAKAYGGHESGDAAFRVLRHLEGAGFGDTSAMRVPEALHHDATRRILFTRAVPGVTLRHIVTESPEARGDAVRAAARWLAALHAAPVGPGRAAGVDPDTVSLGARLVKAAARQPDERKRLVTEAKALERLAGDVPADVPRVRVHARFVPDHVFVTPHAVAVIDWDLSRPGDPAADVAQMVQRLRLNVREAGGRDADADALSRTFLYAYARAGGPALPSLAYHWALATLRTIARSLGRKRARDPDLTARVAHLRADYARIPELTDALAP